MLVIALEGAPARMRGRLSLWFLEVRAGVYVGKANPRLRDRVWEEIVADIGEGNAVMIEPAANEAGFAFRTAGRNRRVPVDDHGLPLVSFLPPRTPA